MAKRSRSQKRKSPKRRSQKTRSPRRKSPRRKSPKRRSQKRKSPRRKSPKRKSPKKSAKSSKCKNLDEYACSSDPSCNYVTTKKGKSYCKSRSSKSRKGKKLTYQGPMLPADKKEYEKAVTEGTYGGDYEFNLPALGYRIRSRKGRRSGKRSMKRSMRKSGRRSMKRSMKRRSHKKY